MILSRQQVEHVVGLAISAPSVLNTQPWRFFAHGDVIDVYALPSRGLPTVDPTAREAYISCGAAVFNLRLAIGMLRRTPVVRLLPDAENVAHVASVRIGDSMTLPADERQLAHAIPRRHTSREPFADEPVPDQIRNALSDAAHKEGARLDFVPASRRDAVVAAIRDADVAQRLNPRVVDEVERWTRYREESTSGIPISALGPSSRHRDGTVRDFALGRAVPRRKTAEFGQQDLLAMLLTLADDRSAWVFERESHFSGFSSPPRCRKCLAACSHHRWKCRLFAASSSMPPSPAVTHKSCSASATDPNRPPHRVEVSTTS